MSRQLIKPPARDTHLPPAAGTRGVCRSPGQSHQGFFGAVSTTQVLFLLLMGSIRLAEHDLVTFSHCGEREGWIDLSRL